MTHHSRRRMLTLMAFAGVLPITAACATPAAPTSSPVGQTSGTTPVSASSPTAQPTTAPVQRQMVTWKHATTGPSYLWVPQKMAAEKGFYKEEGIELEFVTLNTDATINKGLLAGEVDSAETGTSSVLVTRSQGGGVKLLGSWLDKLSYDLITRTEIGSVADLQGKNLAITSVGGLPHVMMLAVLEKYGVDPATVNFVSTPTPNETHIQALLAGTADSGVASAELRWALADKPELKVLTSIADELPQYVRVAYTVTEQVHSTRRDVLERLLRAYSRGVRHALENKADAVELGVRLLAQPAEQIAQAFDLFTERKWINPTGIVQRSSLEWMQDLNLKLKLQDSRVNLDELTDFSIAEKVAKELGA